MNDLTPVQKRVYYIIKDYITQKGYSPSLREIAKLNGNNSVATAVFHVRALKKKGYIDYEERTKRTIQIKK